MFASGLLVIVLPRKALPLVDVVVRGDVVVRF